MVRWFLLLVGCLAFINTKQAEALEVDAKCNFNYIKWKIYEPDTVGKDYIDNDVFICYLENENDRDNRAKEEKTYNNGRFYRSNKDGVGMWYCCYTPDALEALGKSLD